MNKYYPNLVRYLFGSISNEQIINEVQHYELKVPLHHLMGKGMLFYKGFKHIYTRDKFADAIKSAAVELFNLYEFQSFFIFLEKFKEYYQINDSDWQEMTSIFLNETLCKKRNRPTPSTLLELCYMNCKLNQMIEPETVHKNNF